MDRAANSAAIRAAQHDCDVTLVDRDGVGGTCLNHGCIPSKALLTASNLVTELESASQMGIYAEPFVDVGEMVAWKDDVVDQLTGGVEKLCKANGVTVREGTARFTANHAVEIAAADGTIDELEFENAVIATGSRPMSVPGFSFDDDPILNSRQALALESDTSWQLGGPSIDPFDLAIADADVVEGLSARIRPE